MILDLICLKISISQVNITRIHLHRKSSNHDNCVKPLVTVKPDWYEKLRIKRWSQSCKTSLYKEKMCSFFFFKFENQSEINKGPSFFQYQWKFFLLFLGVVCKSEEINLQTCSFVLYKGRIKSNVDWLSFYTRTLGQHAIHEIKNRRKVFFSISHLEII